MKLLIVANYAKGHINKFHIPTIKKFKENGWQVDVACNLDGEVPLCDNAYNLPLERNPFRFKSLKAIKMLKKIIEQNNYDVIHLHTLTGRVVGTLAAKGFKEKGLKIVATYHGLNYYDGSSMLSKLIIPIDRYLSKFCDLSFSDNSEDIIYAKKYRLKIADSIFCPISINVERLLPVEKHFLNRNAIRNSFKVNEDEKLLTYVAELYKNKNQIYLLNSLKILKERGYKVKLMLIGPEADGGELKEAVKNYGFEKDVILTGWRSDIGDLLCASDIYVASSIREGLGINLIEAMLVGLPIVATNNRGHREVIVDGENGYLVDIDSPKSCADRIEEFLTNTVVAEKFIKRGKEIYLEKFSKKTEDVIFEEYQKKLGL